MYKAAICEDEADIARYIEKTLRQEFLNIGIQVSFDVYDNGERLIKQFEMHYHYDMIFMDIEMPDIDGISVCRRIREMNTDTLVVFISNKEELVFSSFEVKPFRFIRKSHYDSMIKGIIPAIREELLRRKPRLIQVADPATKDVYTFDVNSLLYVEAQLKYSVFHTKSGNVEIKVKLMDIESQLNKYDFLKPHRSYLVNPSYISVIRRSEICMKDEQIIPVSRGRIDIIKQQYLEYINKTL
jgi:DNA-binding LytR/AlgR family response regulator